MRIAICPGSFDPVTKGHLNIIERSAKLFDAVTVLVMVNPNKTPSFTAQERADFLRRVTGHIPNVKVDVYTCLLYTSKTVKENFPCFYYNTGIR